MRLLILFTLITGCGINHKIKNNEIKVSAPKEFTFGPNFDEAAEFCDSRYGVGTEEAEECFLDYREFYNLNIGIDLQAIQEYCEDRFEYEEQIACEDELIDLLSNVQGS